LADIRLIRDRIRSIQNIVKVTRSMEMIATTKMRRAQERGRAGHPYIQEMRKVLAALTGVISIKKQPHPLLQRRPVNKIAIVHITPDRGLCGGLQTNLNRLVGNFISEQSASVVSITVGLKGRDFMKRLGHDIQAEFTQLGDRPSLLDTLPVSSIIIDDYSSGLVDSVYIAYSQFVSTMIQKPVLQQVLPIELVTVSQEQKSPDYKYEPSPEVVLGSVLPRFIEAQVYNFILESIASEQSARMVAMRNATENANELIEDLTLAYNKARQESITKELLDITGGGTTA